MYSKQCISKQFIKELWRQSFGDMWYCLPQDGHCSLKREAVSGTDRKAKRRLERDGLDGGGRCRAKKPQKKKIKLNKNKSRDNKAAPSSPSLTSDPSPSEDSEEDMALCPAEDCQQPEGDEVGPLTYTHCYKSDPYISMKLIWSMLNTNLCIQTLTILQKG